MTIYEVKKPQFIYFGSSTRSGLAPLGRGRGGDLDHQQLSDVGRRAKPAVQSGNRAPLTHKGRSSTDQRPALAKDITGTLFALRGTVIPIPAFLRHQRYPCRSGIFRSSGQINWWYSTMLHTTRNVEPIVHTTARALTNGESRHFDMLPSCRLHKIIEGQLAVGVILEMPLPICGK